MSEAPPPVLIVWEDARQLDSGPWAENKDHDYKPHLVHQVGFLLSCGDEGIVITAAWHPETVGTRDQIPKAMIRSMTVLGPVPEKGMTAPKKRARSR